MAEATTSGRVSNIEPSFLDLNEYTLSKFINLMLEHYKKDYHSPLRMMFYGRCEFEFVQDYDKLLFKLKSKHTPTVNLLRNHPELFVHSNFTFGFCFYQTKGNYRVLQEAWKLHDGFWKIEILDYKVTLQRSAPRPLTSLCLRVVDKAGLGMLPEHVSVKLKEAENADEFELCKELEEVIQFKSLTRAVVPRPGRQEWQPVWL